MKILFDHQTFSIQRYGGISRYFANLHHGLNKQPGVDSRIALLYSENEYLKDTAIPMNNALGKKLFSGHYNRIYRWNRRYCNYRIGLNNFDVFHPTYYDTYFLKDLKKPFVFTVHDMIHELFPKQFPDNDEVVERKRQLITAADALIAISEHTKKDIIKFFPETESKISVIHHGYRFEGQAIAKADSNERFILYIGERVSYKNFIPFVKAIAPLLKEDETLQLICTGGGKFSVDEEQLLVGLNVSAQCRQISATDTQLQQLYVQALVFVFPSLIEGFGIPLLEAFSAGCPIAASNNSCFPEIGGDAIAYFDPHSAESMYNTIKSVITDETLRDNLIKKGHGRVKEFTLEKQVEQTLAVYKQAAHK
ncbi:MAG: glycosyltransferase family 1 protein [Bacteroidota bacterium]